MPGQSDPDHTRDKCLVFIFLDISFFLQQVPAMKSEFWSSGASVGQFCGSLKYYWEIIAGGGGTKHPLTLLPSSRLVKIILLLPFPLFPETMAPVLSSPFTFALRPWVSRSQHLKGSYEHTEKEMITILSRSLQLSLQVTDLGDSLSPQPPPPHRNPR